MQIQQGAVTILRPGLVWMLIWAAAGALLSFVIGIIDPPSIDPGEGPVDVARLLGAVGAASGLVFGLLLLVGERGKAIADISMLRAISWGAVAGAALPLLTGVNDVVALNTIPLGALSAALYVGGGRRLGTGDRGLGTGIETASKRS